MPSETTEEELRASEYEAQYFGFTAKALVDTLYNIFSQTYEEEIQNFREKLQEMFSVESTDFTSAIERLGLHNSKRLDIIFNRLEVFYVKDLFRIPEELVLPEDAVQVEFKDMTPYEYEEMDVEISYLEKRLSALTVRNNKMCEELGEINLCKKEMAATLNILRPQVDAAKAILQKTK